MGVLAVVEGCCRSVFAERKVPATFSMDGWLASCPLLSAGKGPCGPHGPSAFQNPHDVGPEMRSRASSARSGLALFLSILAVQRVRKGLLLCHRGIAPELCDCFRYLSFTRRIARGHMKEILKALQFLASEFHTGGGIGF